MNEPREQSRIHPLELERWLLSEQSASERAHVEAHLDAGERAALRAEDEALRGRLLTAIPPEQFAVRVRARAAAMASSKRAAPPVLWSLGLAAVAVSSLLLVSRPSLPVSGTRSERGAASEPAASSQEHVERVKGLEPELRVYRQRGAAVERLANGAVVAAGDVVQLGFVRSSYAFGVLLSIDGRGAVTLHQPRSASGATALVGPAGEQLLSEAYELDDAPTFERFLFVASDRSLSAEAVVAAARRLAQRGPLARSEPLLLPQATVQRSLLLRKSEAP